MGVNRLDLTHKVILITARQGESARRVRVLFTLPALGSC
jgi:hypothetical protein